MALQAQERFPWLSERLGKELARGGSFGAALSDSHDQAPMLRSFPVKYWWRGPADLGLIKKSAEGLAKLAALHPDLVYVLPRPGCGRETGQRDWETEVKPVLEPILPDNVHVIDL